MTPEEQADKLRDIIAFATKTAAVANQTVATATKMLESIEPVNTNTTLEIDPFLEINIDSSVSNIIIKGDLSLLRYIDKKYPNHILKYHKPIGLVDLAAEYGHLHIIKYLHEEKGLYCGYQAIYYAVRRDDLEMLKYLHEKMKIKDSIGSIYNVIENNQMACLRYICEVIGYKVTLAHIKQAIDNKHLDLAMYLIEQVKTK